MARLTVASPFGPLTLFEDAGALVALEWGRGPKGAASDLLARAAAQLEAYFQGRIIEGSLSDLFYCLEEGTLPAKLVPHLIVYANPTIKYYQRFLRALISNGHFVDTLIAAPPSLLEVFNSFCVGK